MSPRVRQVARLLIGIAVLGVLLAGLDANLVAERLAHANLLLAAGGILGLVAVHLLGAVTWRTLIRRLAGSELPWRQTFRLYYIGQALGGVTPANLGGDAFRIHALGLRETRASVWPVLVQRAGSYIALALIAAVALVPLSAAAAWAGQLVVGALLAGVAVAFLPVLLLRAIRVRDSLAQIPRRALPGAVLVSLGLGALFHLASIVLTYLLLSAVASGPLPLSALFAIAVARLAIAFPLTPSGLGVQEGALSVAFAALGLDPAVALAGLLLSRCALLITGALGMALFMGHRGSPAAAASTADKPRSRALAVDGG